MQIGEVTSCGVTGSKAQFTIDLPVHSLSFSSKVASCLNTVKYDLVTLHWLS